MYINTPEQDKVVINLFMQTKDDSSNQTKSELAEFFESSIDNFLKNHDTISLVPAILAYSNVLSLEYRNKQFQIKTHGEGGSIIPGRKLNEDEKGNIKSCIKMLISGLSGELEIRDKKKYDLITPGENEYGYNQFTVLFVPRKADRQSAHVHEKIQELLNKVR